MISSKIIMVILTVMIFLNNIWYDFIYKNNKIVF